jgi:hypothetical protein
LEVVTDIKSLERASPTASLVVSDMEPFLHRSEHGLAQAIVDTIREPLLVLDKICAS